jgi:sulfide:quinone oxidoreductase
VTLKQARYAAVMWGMARTPSQGASRPRVLIVGGGVGGVEAMVALHDLCGDRVEIGVHAPRREFLYRPLAVTEPFGVGEVLKFDLQQLTERCGASFSLGSIVSVDTDGQRATTHDGDGVDYDYLIVASGARMLWTVPGAATFWGVPDEGAFVEVVRELQAGALRKVVFTMPAGLGWPLPVYELALLAGAQLKDAESSRSADLKIVTPEDAPLQLFGVSASEQMGQLLAERGIELVTGASPIKFENGQLDIAPGDSIEADAVVSAPSFEGRPVEGVPHDEDGFIPIDEHSLIRGLQNVFAVGDVTNFPVKQGGLATQQADAAAEVIASKIGSPVEPQPFEPVLRAVLLTGEEPKYLYGKLGGGHGETSTFSDDPPWRDEGKIVGKYLAPFLASTSDAAARALRPSSDRS